MKKVTFLLLALSYSLLSQNISEKLLDTVFNNLTTVNGTSIEFDYLFSNASYDMNEPMKGNLILYSNNRYYLEFGSLESHVIQIYNGDVLYTILMEDQEIQIDNINKENHSFLQTIFNDYKTRFESRTQYENNDTTCIRLTPIKEYNEKAFNNCIDELNLPSCLKLPKQCRIGLKKEDEELLHQCLYNNEGYKETNISYIEVRINRLKNKILSIKQFNNYNGITEIIINKTSVQNESYLTIEKDIYQEFELIDLR